MMNNSEAICLTSKHEYNYRHLSIYLSMALQHFVGPWSLFSFLIIYTVGKTPWTGDQPVAMPLPNTNTEKTQTSMP
jgi:hypothetical protein